MKDENTPAADELQPEVATEPTSAATETAPAAPAADEPQPEVSTNKGGFH